MDWWNLWVPFVGTIVGVFANLYINYKQAKKNEELQKEITKKQIDADLKAKARIEWINDVRKMSANLISSLVDIKNMDKDYEERLVEVSKEAELLKLYFGSYKTDELKTYDLKVLMNKKQMMVKILICFCILMIYCKYMEKKEKKTSHY